MLRLRPGIGCSAAVSQRKGAARRYARARRTRACLRRRRRRGHLLSLGRRQRESASVCLGGLGSLGGAGSCHNRSCVCRRRRWRRLRRLSRLRGGQRRQRLTPHCKRNIGAH